MSTRSVVAALAATVVSVPAAGGTTIWQDIEAGMTVDQVRELYPAGKDEAGRKVEHHRKVTELHGFLQIGRCKPRVEVLHPEGVVTGVYIWMRPEGALRPMCAEEARSAALTKFGEPTATQFEDNLPGDILRGDKETLTWATPDMTVTFYHENRNDAWHIEYSTAGVAAAAGL